jgi:AcrR family transcriptional regulator
MEKKGSVREYQKKRRRERIFRAALELFRKQGFHQTTASEIAEAAHISRGTFFNYYPYKEAVLLEYGHALLSTLREMALARLRAGEEPLSVLRYVFRLLAEGTRAEKDLVLPLLYELLNPDPFRAKAAFEALPLGDLVAEILKPLRERGVVRQDLSLERMGRTLADLYFLAALRWAAYTPNRDFGEEVEKSLSLALEGILARSQPTQVSRKSAKAKA